MSIELNNILQELQKQSEKPLAIHIDGTYTYVIYGLKHYNFNGVHTNIYPILRINEYTVNSTAIDQSSLSELARAGVDLKNDYAGTITLMNGLSFG